MKRIGLPGNAYSVFTNSLERTVSGLLKLIRYRVAPNSEFDRIPNIVVPEEFPNTKYLIVFVHEKISNTEYRIYSFMKNFRIPNTE